MTRVTPLTAGAAGEVAFSAISISPDGRWIVLISASPGVLTGDSALFTNVFLFDRLSGGLTCVNVARDGASGNDHSLGGIVSADGRYVAIRSFASNLLSETAHEATQVLVRDRARFQPDESVRHESGSSFFDAGVFGGAPQTGFGFKGTRCCRVAFTRANGDPAEAARLVAEWISPGEVQNEAALRVLHQRPCATRTRRWHGRSCFSSTAAATAR